MIDNITNINTVFLLIFEFLVTFLYNVTTRTYYFVTLKFQRREKLFEGNCTQLDSPNFSLLEHTVLSCTNEHPLSYIGHPRKKKSHLSWVILRTGSHVFLTLKMYWTSVRLKNSCSECSREMLGNYFAVHTSWTCTENVYSFQTKICIVQSIVTTKS